MGYRPGVSSSSLIHAGSRRGAWHTDAGTLGVGAWKMVQEAKEPHIKGVPMKGGPLLPMPSPRVAVLVPFSVGLTGKGGDLGAGEVSSNHYRCRPLSHPIVRKQASGVCRATWGFQAHRGPAVPRRPGPDVTGNIWTAENRLAATSGYLPPGGPRRPVLKGAS